VLSNESIMQRETLSAMEKRLSTQATSVGVNGDYFSPSDGRPSGIFLRDGVLATPPSSSRSSAGVTLDGLLDVRRVSFRDFPETIPTAQELAAAGDNVKRMGSEDGIEFRLRWPTPPANRDASNVLLVVLNADEAGTEPEWLAKVARPNQTIVFCEPRGIGETKWTRKNGPNYVERSHVLLGRTVDAGRVWDVIAAAKYLRDRPLGADRPLAAGEKAAEISVAGNAAAGLIAAYAAVLEPQIAGVSLVAPPATHMDKAAPQLLNVLRVCDAPQALGLLAPRPLTVLNADATSFAPTAAAYKAAEAGDRLRMEP
jgi:hypothetical protein